VAQNGLNKTDFSDSEIIFLHGLTSCEGNAAAKSLKPITSESFFFRRTLTVLHDLGLLGVFCLAHRAGLEVEWSAVEKPLRKAVKKYIQNGSSDGDGDEDMGEAQVAEDELVDRHVTVTCFAHDVLFLISYLSTM